MIKIQPISSEAEYEAALDEIETYFNNEPALGTPAAHRFDVLARAIQDYEDEHWPIAT
jgi:HTH-type transcriptional regulator/antitoxin HigA